ncbi:RNA-binding transcriptional accessory protein [Crassaminicella thermophila]|uniref:RNA-binding transcriptional accessory protein n=1 Tax=Crassaminicella thermophila TaxID=2599308 RepID=A0A5C0S9J5_CRATE|nr:Tex family protein [Crassaminicella thermophila]QEK11335.1 RNA-binding transcriptional accessory protein [Crassaminicella thermophila]
MDLIAKQLAKEFQIKESQVKATIELIDQGNTIPFIARYRKEVTGELSDTVLRELFDRLTYLRNLEKRKEEVIRLIHEQDKLTEELKEKIQNAITLTEVEDLYRPFRPKRRTRATIAKEKGLEPLAEILFSQEIFDGTIEEIAVKFVNEEKDVNTVEEAIEGAQDIIAEKVSDNADYRKKIRNLTFYKGIVVVVAANPDEKSVYEMYYDYKEPVKKILDHRVLAINRGEKEKILKVKIDAPVEDILYFLKSEIVKKRRSITSSFVEEAVEDSYKRLIAPSIEREIRNELTERAEEKAIKVFATNLNNLLLQPPMKDMVVMGFDPAYRTGCKIAVVDETGKLLDTTTVYPTEPQNDIENAKKVLKELIEKYGVNIIAIGNGTASRESEMFVAEMIQEIDRKIYYLIVNEAGASVYSASKLAAEEYPDINVSLRGAISIARRLQDPLAELVKIEPKHIGVGQYQHDVNQSRLDEALKGVVEDAVNRVGVDLNTASASLLQYISGISKSVAKNIVKYREENGKFKDRKELLKVSRLGPSAFVQCAGFLRISDGKNVLDNTAVHPESYGVAEKLLSIIGYSLDDVKNKKLQNIKEEVDDKKIEEWAKELEVGIPTLKDILNELKKPGRDPRDEMPKPIFRTDVLKIEDLKPDMILTGTVRNVIDFGAFVDIGIKNDGLVHISEMSDKFIKNPMDVVSVGDVVKVRVLKVDMERQKVSLSMKI